MNGKTEAYCIWAPAILALLIVGLLPSLVSGVATDDAVVQDTAITITSVTTPALTPATASTATAIDEQQAAHALEAQVIEVYDDVSPSVVNITSRTYLNYGFMGTVPEEGTGSGFIYDTEGHIITNYHVIEAAEELLVTLAGGQVYEAQVVGSDPTNDLAILYVDAMTDLPVPLCG